MSLRPIISLSYAARRGLVEQLAPDYRQASSAHKTLLLDQVVAVTGYARKYAIGLLNQELEGKRTIQRRRVPRYGPEVQQALLTAWKAAKHICAKRLIPFLPTYLRSYTRAAWIFTLDPGEPKPSAPGECHHRRAMATPTSQDHCSRACHDPARPPAQAADSHSHLPSLE